MDTAEIEVFLVLAEELHFGRTAERLRLPQPRVSRLVAALERRVGGALFGRTSRRVRLTPLGQQLASQLRPVYAQLVAALDDARAAARETAGVIRIGFSPTSNMEALTRLVEAFEARHPGSQAVLDVVSNFDPYSALRRGELDVLVNWLAVDEPDLTVGPVLEQRDRVLAVASGDPLAARPSVSLEDLADREVALMPFPPALYDAIIPPRTPSGRVIRRTRYAAFLTSSTRLKAGDSSRGSRRAVGSRFTGRAAPSPPRAATACPAAVWCWVVHVPAWLSQTCSIVPLCGGRKWRFLPGLKAGVWSPRS